MSCLLLDVRIGPWRWAVVETLRVSWYLQLPLCGILRVASSSQHSTPCQHYSLSLYKSCGLAFKGALFQSLLKWLYLTRWSLFFKYHFIFTWNEAVVWGSSGGSAFSGPCQAVLTIHVAFSLPAAGCWPVAQLSSPPATTVRSWTPPDAFMAPTFSPFS